MSSARLFRASGRARGTDAPIIVQMKELMRDKKDVLSLAQGIVHWEPPLEALRAVAAAPRCVVDAYGPAEGVAALQEGLLRKMRLENGLVRSEVMATAGANQAYANCCLALLDAGDAAVIFRPYYFNHLMAIQMTNAKPLEVPMTAETFLPRVDALEDLFSKRNDVRLVTVVNPSNPTGTRVPPTLLRQLSDLCEANGAFLVVDNTYEYFTWSENDDDDERHEDSEKRTEEEHCFCVEGDHVVNIFRCRRPTAPWAGAWATSRIRRI